MKKAPRNKTKLGSYKFISVLFSTTLSLFIVGLFGVIVIQAKTLTSIIRENIEIQVFLNTNITEEANKNIGELLASKPYVLQKEDKKTITYVSRDEAAATFLLDTGEDFTKFLDDNPLRDSYTFSVTEEFQTAEQIEEIVDEMEALEGVFEVTYMNDLVESINRNLLKVSLVLGAFILILIVTVVMLINNTIKLALFSQRFLIRSMQLVGATKSFIRKPFIVRSVLHGTVSALIASALLFGLLSYGSQELEGLGELQNQETLLIIVCVLLLSGILIASFSTYRAMQKYMVMSLDELY